MGRATADDPMTAGPRPVAGRPRDPAKDAAILTAARDLFFERGFSASTIEEIARLAGVSKVTVYGRFGDKEKLFEICVRNEIARMVQSIEGPVDSGADLEARLNDYGISLLTFMFRPNHVALDRVTAQEFVQMPSLGRRVFEAGPAQTRGRLAALLKDACDTGLLACDDPLRAAEDLLSLWRGFADVELKFGIRDTMDADEIAARVRHGTATFLRAYHPGPDNLKGQAR